MDSQKNNDSESKLASKKKLTSEDKKKLRKKKFIREQKRKIQSEKNRKKKLVKIYSYIFISIILVVFLIFIFFTNKSSNNIQNIENTQKTHQNQIDFSKLDNIQKDEIINQNLNTDVKLLNWNKKQIIDIKNYIANNSIDNSFTEAAKNPEVGIFSLMTKKDKYSDVLSKQDFLNQTTNYPDYYGTGVIFNQLGFVTNVIQDSPAYLSGIHKNWQILNLNNTNDQSKYNSFLSNNNSVWRDYNNNYYTLKPLQNYPPIGLLASSFLSNGIINIKIDNITSMTAWRVYSIINNYINQGTNIKGILIDLRVEGDFINGIPELTWILNGGNNSNIAILKDRNNKIYNLYANKPNFNINDNVIKFIKNIKKIVVVNNQTKGLTEALALNLYNSNYSIYGTQTYGKNTIETTFITGDKGIKVSTYTFNLPNNYNLPLVPPKKINFSILDKMYQN